MGRRAERRVVTRAAARDNTRRLLRFCKDLANTAGWALPPERAWAEDSLIEAIKRASRIEENMEGRIVFAHLLETLHLRQDDERHARVLASNIPQCKRCQGLAH